MEGKVYQLNTSKGGIPKNPVELLRVTRLGAVGDNHDDKVNHGGLDRAICIYSFEEYERWAALRLKVLQPQPNLKFRKRVGDRPRPGDFGENITTIGINHAEIRIGDVFRVGEVVIEITMPRKPCMTVGGVFGAIWVNETFDRQISYGDPTSPKWGKSGFKARVLREGLIRREDTIVRESSGEGGMLPRG